MRFFIKRISLGSNLMKKYQRCFSHEFHGIQEGNYFLIPTIKLVVKKYNWPDSWIIEDGFPSKRFTLQVVFLSFYFWIAMDI